MLVVLHFHQLGYGPLQIAMLFLFYEIFGVVTNLVGGWLGARIGLNRTMNVGLALQVIALAMLLVPTTAALGRWLRRRRARDRRALVEAGYAEDLSDAFARYIGGGKPAFVPRPRVEVTTKA